MKNIYIYRLTDWFLAQKLKTEDRIGELVDESSRKHPNWSRETESDGKYRKVHKRHLRCLKISNM